MRYQPTPSKMLFFLIIFSLSSCNFFENYFTTKGKSLEFINALLANDFAKCVNLMPLELYPQANLDTMQMNFRRFKGDLDTHFGTNLKPTFIAIIHDIDSTVNPPKTRQLGLVQLANNHFYGNFEIRFDNKTGKVDNIEMIFKKEIPSKTFFNAFAFFALIVSMVNLFAIWKVIKSTLSGKWKWIVAIVFLNYPAYVYPFTKGAYLSWTSFPLVTNVGGHYFFNTDIDETKIFISLPIGTIWVLYKLYCERNNQVHES